MRIKAKSTFPVIEADEVCCNYLKEISVFHGMESTSGQVETSFLSLSGMIPTVQMSVWEIVMGTLS